MAILSSSYSLQDPSHILHSQRKRSMPSSQLLLVFITPVAVPFRHHPPAISSAASPIPTNMCEFEEYLFSCGCSQMRLKSYCHYARNHPKHYCLGVKKLRDVWDQQTPCQACLANRARHVVGLSEADYLRYQQGDQMLP